MRKNVYLVKDYWENSLKGGGIMLEQLEQKPVDAALEIIQRQQQAVTAATESITNTGN